MKKYLLTVIAGALIISSCSTLKVTTDYDKTTDFSQYKTYSFYGWAKESHKLLNQIDQKRFEDAFANEFAKRGIKYVPKGGDLVVSLYIVTQKKQSTTATTNYMGGYAGGYYGWGPGWGWGPSFGGGTSYTTVNTYDYEVGTLIIDVFDAKKKQLVWEAIGKKEINENTSGRAEKIQQIAKKMMEKFPIPPQNEKKKK